MGEPEIGAEDETTAPAENSGAGPQAAGTNAVMLEAECIFTAVFVDVLS